MPVPCTIQDGHPASYFSNGTGHWRQKQTMNNNFPHGAKRNNTGPDLLEHHERTHPILQSLPSFNHCLGSLDLIISISVRLSDQNSFAATAIRDSIKRNVPSEVILRTIKDMATDNRAAVDMMLGRELMEKILRA